MKRYEGLFILNTAGKEEGVKELVDKITAEITRLGGKLETVQKMDKRPFSRVVEKTITSGFYVNIIFEAKPDTISQLRSRLSLVAEVHRVLFTYAAAPVAVEAVAAV